MNEPTEKSPGLGLRIEAEIESWFVETIHQSPVSRATEIFNHVRAAVDALKARLAALLQEQ
ncbi:hypothetical protein [Rhodoblastus sp.]|uniref:hypothetical protein n=1 Tax=Rhodoblastus sp. TaxID=1962975 RepID=UPI003F994A9C